MKKIILTLFWPEEKISFSDHVDKTTSFLQKISAYSPLFNNLFLVNGDSKKETTTPLAKLKEKIAEHAIRLDRNYTNLDPNGKIQDQSYCKMGFVTHLTSSQPRNDVSIIITEGGYEEGFINNCVSITLSENCLLEFSGSEVRLRNWIVDLILLNISHWKACKAKIFNFQFSKILSGSKVSDIGWISFFKHISLEEIPAKSELLGMGITWEAVPQGGTLFMLDQEMVSADNPEHVARGKLLRARLMEHGWIEN
ncbi:Imm52 family immunity protein [Massilia sp. W12]|uniref:Imm52 family immunity protein n=1 Tax=Massilia sp. W12 TaxID=3126507 RepID=UPI0030D34679